MIRKFSCALITITTLICTAWSINAADLPKSVTIKIGYEVGTSYDTLGRIVANRIAKYLGSDISIDVENVPGASGLVLSRKISESEPRDGSVIGLVPLGLVRNSLIDPKTVSVDPRKLNWIGSVSMPVIVCFARNEGEATVNFEKNAAVKLAAGSKGGYSYYIGTALRSIRFKDLSVIGGFKNELEMLASVDRKETDVICGFTLQTFQRLALDDRMTIIGTITPSTSHQAAGIPYLFSKVSDLDRKALDILISSATYFYPLVLPPEVPDEVIAKYRVAFEALSKDQEFLDDLKKNNFDPTLVGGQVLQGEIIKILSSDVASVERARELAN